MKSKILLITILITAASLRLVALSKYPAGLNADEAALGYNAYSLLTTGRDEHGHAWPINLESFGDFKPAGYAYLLLPFVKVLGLTELAVRLPSALAGIWAVYVLYLLVKELGEEKLALMAAAVLAVSPWHLHFSRGGWETNIATTLLLVAAWGWVKWTKTSQIKYIATTVVSLVFSLYVYQSTRVIAPLLGLGWAILSWRQVWAKRKSLILLAVLSVLLVLPLAWSLVKSDAGSRLSGVGLLADQGPVNRAQELRGQHADWNSPLSRVLHNRWLLYGLAFFKNYADHFGGNFLFVNGDLIERNKVPETGLLYLTDLIVMSVGLVVLIRKGSSNYKFIWWWLLVAPLASAMTFQTPHAIRAFNMVIPLTTLVAVGINTLLSRWKTWAVVVLSFVYIWQFARYLHQYYNHYPQTYPAAWEYGFKELVAYVDSVAGNYDQVLVTDKYDQPYILFLFYSKYPPHQFQSNHELTFRDKFNFSTVRDYDKFHFAATPWDKVRDIHSSLIVAAPEDIPEVGVNIVKTIYFPNGQPAFKIVSN